MQGSPNRCDRAQPGNERAEALSVVRFRHVHVSLGCQRFAKAK
jgi:hypothetical protein